MIDEIILSAENVSMCFNMYKEKIHSLKEYVIKFVTGNLFFEEFWALKDVSFDVKKGELLGIVGLNGAGKSTLLKVIAGVLKPTEGSVCVRGTIAPLIELGAGFDMDLTARENIFLNGAIMGYSRDFMQKKFDEIVAFSELENFLDVSLKNFSSGMKARLGFSIATLIQPDILLVDEILSVGDFQFRAKCQKRINETISQGTTVILVSHSIEEVKKLCNRVIWLEHGKIKMIGNTLDVCKCYITGRETS